RAERIRGTCAPSAWGEPPVGPGRERFGEIPFLVRASAGSCDFSLVSVYGGDFPSDDGIREGAGCEQVGQLQLPLPGQCAGSDDGDVADSAGPGGVARIQAYPLGGGRGQLCDCGWQPMARDERTNER